MLPRDLGIIQSVDIYADSGLPTSGSDHSSNSVKPETPESWKLRFRTEGSGFRT